MTVAATIYVANQDTAKFPVELLVETLGWADRIHLWGGDDESFRHLHGVREVSSLAERISIHRSPFGVASRDDTVKAQNDCIDRVFEIDDADYVCLIQADIWVRPEIVEAIRTVMKEEDGKNAGAWDFGNYHVRLYCVTDYDHFGCTLLRRGTESRFLSTSAYVEPSVKTLGGTLFHTADIGYLTPEMTYHKFRQWQKLCPDGDKEAYLDVYPRDRGMAVERELRRLLEYYRLKNYPYSSTRARGTLVVDELMVVEQGGVLGPMIEALSLPGEYEMVKQLVKEVNDGLPEPPIP